MFKYRKAFIAIAIILLVFAVVKYAGGFSPNDGVQTTKVSFSVTNHVLKCLNQVYSKTDERIFPQNIKGDTVIGGTRLDTLMDSRIFQEGGDPWGKTYQFKTSSNGKYLLFMSSGANRRTGNVKVDDLGNVTGTDKDDIYAVFTFTNDPSFVVREFSGYSPNM